MNDPKRVCVVNTHPIQYFAPFYAYLAQDRDIDLTVLYLSDFSVRGETDPGFGRPVKWDIDLLSGYRYKYVGRAYDTAKPEGFFSLLSFDLFRTIYRGKFDAVVIHGYAHAVNIVALLAAKLSGAKIFYRADTNVILEKRRRQSRTRKFYISRVLSACDKILCVGKRNREFFEWMGVPAGKLVDVPFSVDNKRFVRENGYSQEQIAANRERLSIGDRLPTVLFASKFIPSKNAEMTIRVAGKLAARGLEFNLVVAGSGELRDHLQEVASGFDALNVVFPGFVNQSEMPALLEASDIFAFPSSSDPWGLVVNEAMAAGLPVVVGAESGCAPDLVEDGVNGFIVPTNDDGPFENALEQLLVDPDLRRRMAEASLRRIARWSFRETRAGWRRALELPGDVA